MTWLLVQCGEHWKGNRFTGPISFSVRLTKKDNRAYDELVETIYQWTWISRDKTELKLTSHVKTEDDTITLFIMSADDVEFIIIHKEKVWATIDVEFVNKHEFRPPANPIQSACTVSPVKPIENPRSPVVVDDNDSSESSDTEYESGDDDGGQGAIEDGTEERGVSGTPNSSSPSMNTRWTVSGLELCSIKVVRSVDVFEKPADQVSDRHNGIFNAMEAIFPDAAHGICAYHLAQNLKRFYKQRDDVIWLYYLATYGYRIEEFDRVMSDLKETYYEHIKDRTETAHRCEIHLIHFNTFKVDNKWKETTVDLDVRYCSCRQWDLDELPCSHAMTVARFKGVSINALASNLYTTGFLKHAYEMGVNPNPDPEFWDIPDAIRNRIVLPWKKKNFPGRPKKLRIPSAWEKRKLQSCSKCSLFEELLPAAMISSKTKDDLSLGTIPRPNRTVPRPAQGLLLYSLATSSIVTRVKKMKYLSNVLYEMGKKSVYVVFKGRKTGVFNSWPDCHEHVDGFPGASYQKFNSTDEAYKMISSRSGHSSHSWLESSMNVEEKESSVNVEEKVFEKS
ncbi:hypothetical protein Dsin_030496 [Dipteronia sinensis]|uniref:Ribonuclease H n=1 Tax=Dipteronia sinensis TaxID=43782 RepID=A0AAD9ZKP4_9ROSI|nr:hypothetical protein Dsin_030496 [Dipteronia sinensis]